MARLDPAGGFLHDSLHLATAIEAGATAFVTSDRRLRRIREVPIVVVSDHLPRRR